jgi:hypothetical protein
LKIFRAFEYRLNFLATELIDAEQASHSRRLGRNAFYQQHFFNTVNFLELHFDDFVR